VCVCVCVCVCACVWLCVCVCACGCVCVQACAVYWPIWIATIACSHWGVWGVGGCVCPGLCCLLAQLDCHNPVLSLGGEGIVCVMSYHAYRGPFCKCVCVRLCRRARGGAR